MKLEIKMNSHQYDVVIEKNSLNEVNKYFDLSRKVLAKTIVCRKENTNGFYTCEKILILTRMRKMNQNYNGEPFPRSHEIS